MKKFFWKLTNLDQQIDFITFLMKMLKKLRSILFFFCVTVVFSSCAREVVVKRVSHLIKDAHWVDKNTLQIIVHGRSQDKNVPFKYQRQLSCQNAKENIKNTFYEMHPDYDFDDLDIEIKYTLYTQQGGCGLVVWLSKNSLSEEIPNKKNKKKR